MRVARQIADVVQTSDRAHQYDLWQPPTVVNTPIANLPVFWMAFYVKRTHFVNLSRVQPILYDSIGATSMVG